jgi:RHS repeat-associated protein
MFHHFANEPGIGLNCLVRSTDFIHSQPNQSTGPTKPFYSFLLSVTESGHRRNADGSDLSKSLPPVEFEYTEAAIDETVRVIDARSLENLPCGLDGTNYRWVDLDGEGVSGILTEQSGMWFYKPNLSPANQQTENGRQKTVAQFGPSLVVERQPSLAALWKGGGQLLALSGDGQLDLVEFDSPTPGFFERTEDENWSPFKSFQSLPALDWRSPNLKFVDVTGDGLSDVLISEDHVFCWHTSLGAQGFGPEQRVAQALDEEKGPKLLFADGTESIFLSDMSGDGLTDIMRIRNGEVCYWPNLGYGRFGAKVTMDNAPWFEAPDLFDGRRIRLADIDGSATTDMIYFASGGVHLYFNQSGNAWGERRVLSQFPPVESVSSATALDLLGNGTACLAWSSPLSVNARQPMRYVDLMGGQKPHLLVRVANNLGAETRVGYAASTRFAVADKLAGTPWLTRIPFPVQVVERVETYDYISRNRFVTLYAYHHGYYDGVEREFRGFGRVDQWDTEEFAALSTSSDFPTGNNIDAASHVPPVLTKTWFHTGAYFQESKISKQFEHEYYREWDKAEGMTGLTDQQFEAMLIPDTVFPSTVKMPDGSRLAWNLSGDELRESYRALKGSILRQEIYGLDATEAQDRPYSVSERNYTIECLQPRADNKHAVFFTHPRESLDFQYERKLYRVAGGAIADPKVPLPPSTIVADPRVSHAVTLEVDSFGDVLKSVAIAYGRRLDDYDPVLTVEDKQKQKQALLTYSENLFTNAVLLADSHRSPLLGEVSTYELIHVTPDSDQPLVTNLFLFPELQRKIDAASDGAHNLPYEDIEAAGAKTPDPYRRLVERSRTLYRKDDLSSALPLGGLERMGLPYERYKLAFTPALLSSVYQRQRESQPPESLLPHLAIVFAKEGGYVDLDGNGDWWVPSGKTFYSPADTDVAAQELAYAWQHFFIAFRFRDPFQQITRLAYDAYDLLVLDTEDAVGNRVTAGERDPAGNITSRSNDYRTLKPALLMDANRNRSAVSFDALGMVTGTALMGKPEESLGDSLAAFTADLDPDLATAHLQEPLVDPQAILLQASTRVVYDLFAYQRSRYGSAPQPAAVYALARETHTSDLAPGRQTKVHHSFSYSDGFGREIQKKTLVDEGPGLDGVVNPRWIGSGWSIFNNKGRPVRQYETFFGSTHEFEFAKAVGVSSILFYDPRQRVVATLHPNHTYEKVVFDTWQQETWDVNDTVTQSDPRTDANVGGFLRRLPSDSYLPTWLSQHQGGLLGAAEQSAASKAILHADTPTVAHFDSLGRPFLTVAHNRFTQDGISVEAKYASRVTLDIKGNQRSVRDALDRTTSTYDYDLLGRLLHQSSVDGGDRWTLGDVAEKPMRGWSSRGFQFRHVYDALRRLTQLYLRQGSAAEILVEQTFYGEAGANPEALNSRGRLRQHFDQAGAATNSSFDFKGNLTAGSRQLAIQYDQPVDWSLLANLQDPEQIASASAPSLQGETFTSSSSFDALNRPLTATTPDGSVARLVFNQANLLEQVKVNLRGAATATSFVNDIEYNARGQRVLVDYGNGVRTEYGYDGETFRLVKLRTTRALDNAVLQDLSYAYDPIGNVTAISDAAQPTVYFRNQVVVAAADYTYDALYRLTAAHGREHIGQISQPQTDWDDTFRMNQPLPTDGQAMRNYVENYSYDPVGNQLQIVHQAMNGNWIRTYAYDEPNSNPTNNRLTSTTVGAVREPYTYDLHGNITSMPHLPQVTWNSMDQLASTRRQVANNGSGATTYYVYDASGQRVRKVTESPRGIKGKERIYLGSYEIYREYGSGASAPVLERQTLHVMDGKIRLALAETKTSTNAVPILRYQFTNHLGSASLELDAGAAIISYEEYYAYGSTSMQAVSSNIEVSAKRYRYIGKERDEETGLYYHGARYYASWLGRWISCEPLDLSKAEDSYTYARNRPTALVDDNGRDDNIPPIVGVGPKDCHANRCHTSYPSGTHWRGWKTEARDAWAASTEFAGDAAVGVKKWAQDMGVTILEAGAVSEMPLNLPDQYKKQTMDQLESLRPEPPQTAGEFFGFLLADVLVMRALGPEGMLLRNEVEATEALSEIGKSEAQVARTEADAARVNADTQAAEFEKKAVQAQERAQQAEASAEQARQKFTDKFQTFKAKSFAVPTELQEKVQKLHAALDKIAQSRKTTAIGIVETPDGLRLVVASSDTAVPKAIKELAEREGILIARGEGHAEATIIKFAADQKFALKAIAPSRDFCAKCWLQALQTDADIHGNLSTRAFKR